MRIVKLMAAIIAPVLLAAPAAHAADASKYPEKPIRVIIGSAAGSGPDIISRVLADRLHEVWGQRLVVDARPGAAGVVSAETALLANRDGYTWMVLTSQLFVATSVFKDLKFNLAKDFQSISLLGTVPFVQVVNPKLPANSIPELIALAKKNPGKLRFGSAGTGASEHLSGVLFTQLTGTSMLHVPYKGIAQAITDVISNEVQLTYAVFPAAKPHIENGRLRALGVTTPKRAPLLPNVPAIAEFVPGYAMYGWYSLVAPAGTPDALLTKISAEVVKAVKDPAFGEKLKVLGIEADGGDRKALDTWRASETKRIGDLVKASGASAK